MNKELKERLKDVKSILVSQPKPQNDNSPYYNLADKYGVKVDFRPFIEVQPIELKEFRISIVRVFILFFEFEHPILQFIH